MSPFAPGRSGWGLWRTAGLLALFLLARPVAAGPLERFTWALEEERKLGPDDEHKALLQGELPRLAADLRHPGDLWQALLLVQREAHDVEGDGAPLRRRLEEQLVRRLEGLLRRGLQAPVLAERLAAARFLRQIARQEMLRDQDPLSPIPGPDRPLAPQGAGYGFSQPQTRTIPAPGRPLAAQGGRRYFVSRFQPDVEKVIRQDREPEARAAAALALAWITADGADVVPVLERLRKGAAVERCAVAGAVADLTDRLTGRRPELTLGAGADMREVPRLPDAGLFSGLVRLIGKQMEDSEAEVLARSLQSLRRWARVWVACTRPLCPAASPLARGRGDLEDAKRSAQQDLAQSLAAGLPMAALTRPLIGLLGHKDVKVALAAHEAAEAFAEAARVAADAEAALLKLASPAARPEEKVPGAAEEEPEVQPQPVPPPAREASGFGLVSTAVASPGLLDSLGHEDVRVRLAALYVLETLGPKAAPAVGGLVKALRDDNGFVRWGAVRTLRMLAPEGADRAVPALADVLGREKNQTVRLTAVAALERYGNMHNPTTGKANRAVEALGQALSLPEPRTRESCIKALASIGDPARPVVPALVKQLGDPEAAVRAAAADALGRLSPRDRAVRAALQPLLKDPDEQVRASAGGALLAEAPPEPPPPPEPRRPRRKGETDEPARPSEEPPSRQP